MSANSSASISTSDSIVQVKIHDGSGPDEDFQGILSSLLDVYKSRDRPFVMIFNSLGETLSATHIYNITTFLHEIQLPTDLLLGTAIILDGTQVKLARLAKNAFTFTRPVEFFPDEESAAEFVLSLGA